jgi:hypothetical protein
MANNLTKKQKRKQKKNVERKIQLEVQRKQRQELIEQEAQLRLQQRKILDSHQHQGIMQHQTHLSFPQEGMSGDQSIQQNKLVVNYIADKNGCGYFRCIWPFELLSTYKNTMSFNTFMYHMEPSIIERVHTFRFQRQATNQQLIAWKQYYNMRRQWNYQFKMQYEIDDLLMDISPENKIAYNYFDEEKKRNHIEMLKMADSITFSTEPLKNIYVDKYGIDANKIKIVRNHLPQFMYSLPYRNATKLFSPENKPRIFWSGSASHIGPGGDLSFLIPLIEKTVDEYQWVFQGTIPSELVQYVKDGKIEFIPWVPIYGLANIQFYKAKPDIYIAPLKPSVFNSCKSDLKYLEACALGCPCITTSFEEAGLKSPYDLSNAEICLEPDGDIWKTMIDYLIQNSEYYINTVKNQYKFINSRWMENNLQEWLDVI